jgi:F-type H+-transporting ATPase subunit a
MFPLKIIEALSQPLSLGFCLFGNILGGVIVMSLIFTGLGSACHALAKTFPFLDTVPLLEAVIPLPANLFFDVFEPIVQAYIFTMLTMVFLSMEIVKHGAGENH